ncbi:MAG: RHS repeat-associated core domain-containing protein, partial [Halanaerobiales bacterium]|nr:RHS repeat-associated core domain-containing protein [Halanaerobiales bacterium]
LLEYISNPEYPDDSSKWMKYDYDANHNLRFITYTNQAGRYSIEYFYSPLNQVEEIHYPDGTSEIYKYDDFRRLEQITYGNGDWVKYNYTLKNQLESLEYSDGETVSYTYDKFGNRETMTDKRGVITYIYDDLHRLYQEILPNIEPNIESDYTQYDYDEVDNLVSITMSDGNKLSYEYNKVNKLKKVTDTYSGGNTIYSYDRIYNVTDVTYPDGTIEHYDYDKANRVIEVSYGNVVLPTYNYIYYKNGNLLEKYTDDNSIYYYYDAMNQLTRVRQYGRKVVGPAIFYGNDPTKKKEEEFDYDPMGNRILWKDNGVETTYTYDANNKLTNLQKNAFGQITPTSFSYDDRGNMTSKGSTTYQYNAQGLLKSINKDGNNYVFGYDGDGRRYQQKINHKTIDYLYDKNWNLLSTTGTGPFGLGIKGYINGLKTIGVQEDGGVNYNYHDHQGSTVGVKSGSSVQSYDYSPFGIDSVVVDDFSYVDSPLNHGWQVYTSSDYSGILSTVFDDTLQNQVMRIQSSHGTNFGIAYGYPTNNLNVKRTDLSVKYRADEGIVLFVRVLGENGSQYYLTYRIGYDGSPSVSGMYYNIYLGSSTKDGAWRVLERDLNEDLKEGYGIELDKVLWFCIRGGDYDLDDVKLGGQDLTGNTRKYTDEDQDGTGLYYLRNRYYDPELGRFITADSYRGSITDPLSLNRYIYVKNNPLKYIDPSGHMAQITGGTSSKAEGYNYGDINFVIIGDNVVVCDVKKNSVHINLEEGDARKLGVNLIGAGLMAKAVKVEYRNLIGEDLDIKTGSIAIEIWGHVAAHEVADFMTPVYKKGADKIKNRTRIIDIGTSAVDNNRFLWDALYYAPLL